MSERDKELLSVRVRNEGEFWMAFDDFAKQFSHLDLVHIGPDDWMSEPSLQSKKPWRAVLARRRWRSGYNAGGSPTYIDTTSMNPQFHIQIPRSPSLSKCHVVVSVTQQYETNTDALGENKKRKKRKLHHIGFAVYEVPPHMTRLTPLYVAEHVSKFLLQNYCTYFIIVLNMVSSFRNKLISQLEIMTKCSDY